MARSFLRNVVSAITIIATAFGTITDDGTELQKFKFNEADIYSPTFSRWEDTMVGDGKPFKRKGRIKEYNPRELAYAGILNTSAFIKCARWFAGGTIPTATTVSGSVKDYFIYPKTAGTVPMLNNVIQILGKKSFLSANCYLESFQVSQSKKDEPNFQISGGNNGHSINIDDTNIDPADIATLASYYRFDANATKVTCTDGTTSFDWAGDKRLISVDATLNQNVEVEGLPGDDYVNASAKCQGSLAGSITVGVHTGQVSIKVYADPADNLEFQSYKDNKTITDLKITFKTCETIATGYYHEFEIVIPVAEMSVATSSENGQDAYTITFDAIEGDNTSLALFWFRWRALSNTFLT